MYCILRPGVLALANGQCVTNWHKVTNTLFTPQSQWLLGKNDTRRTHYQPPFLTLPRVSTQLPCCWTLTLLDGPLYDGSHRCRGNGVHQWQLPLSGWTEVRWGSGGVKYGEHMWRTTRGRNVSPGSLTGSSEMSLELRKDKTHMAGLLLLPLIPMGPFVR